MLKAIEHFEKETLNSIPTFDQMIEFLDNIFKIAYQSGGLLERNVLPYIADMWYTRVSSILTKWVVNYENPFTFDQFEKLCLRKTHFQYLFHASGYRGMTHLIPMMGNRDENGAFKISASRLPILLIVLPLDEISDELMGMALKVLPSQPNILFLLLMSWLNQRAVLTEQGEKNRTRLLSLGHLIEQAQVQDRHIGMLIRAYMYCTYASTPTKHDIKETINKLLSDLMHRANIKPKPVHHHPNKKRPTMVVVHEHFTAPHAMFRCYAPYIRSLSEYFDLIAVADSERIDSASNDLFKQVIALETKKISIKELAIKIQDLAPDIIYYPSLGMSTWTVMLSNLRLAPVQIATQGHPATTRSKEIDYVSAGIMEGDLTQVFSEKVLVGHGKYQFEAHKDLPLDNLRRTRKPDGIVHIAVNSKVMKLSYRLIDICKRLQKEAKVPVKFHFFPGERGIYHDGIVSAIKNQLPEAEVYGMMPYPAFLQAIKNCDLSLAAFPFGNTNSTVDTCLLGIPTVAHFGPESPAQSDKFVLETAGAPLWLVSDTDEGYFQTALKLVNDEKLRKQTVEALTHPSIRENLVGSTACDLDAGFAKLVHYAYRHHAQLIASPERVFRYSEIFAEGNAT